MEFTKSLIKGKLIKRYKRFFTDVRLSKEIVTAHCPNTGSMKGLLDEGNEVYLLPNNDPKRKLKYGLEIIKSRKNLVGCKRNQTGIIANGEVLTARHYRLSACITPRDETGGKQPLCHHAHGMEWRSRIPKEA